MKWFRPAEAAVLKGCSKSTIERALKRGDLVAKRGKISEADLACWEKDPRGRAKREAAAAVPVADHTPDASPGAAPPDPEPKLTEIQRAAQRMKIIELERAERAWQREQGLTVERASVDALLTDFAALLRTEAQSFPRRRLSDVMRQFGPADGRRVMRLLEEFADQFLERLADELPKRLAGSAERKAS